MTVSRFERGEHCRFLGILVLPKIEDWNDQSTVSDGSQNAELLYQVPNPIPGIEAPVFSVKDVGAVADDDARWICCRTGAWEESCCERFCTRVMAEDRLREDIMEA